MIEPYVEITTTIRVRGRAAVDAALKGRQGPDAAAYGLLQLIRHYQNPTSTEEVEFIKSRVST